MNRNEDFPGLQVAFAPFETDEEQHAACGKTAPYQPGAAVKPASYQLVFKILPATDTPAPVTARSGHIPEYGSAGQSMPFYYQEDSNGSSTTSLSMVLAYFGIDIPPGAIDQAIRRTNSSLGCALPHLIEFARDHGLTAEGYNNGAWEQVKSIIDQGSPCMASIDKGSRHLIVITGYATGRDRKERVLYHDTELVDENGVPGKEQSMPLDDFKANWGAKSFGVTNFFAAFAPAGSVLPKSNDNGAEGALGTVAGAANVLNGFDRIFSPDCFGSFVHGIPQLFGGLLQTAGCGAGALLQVGAGWFGNKVEGIPVLENLVQPFMDLVSGVGACVADVCNGLGQGCDSVGGALQDLCHGDAGGFAKGWANAAGNVVRGGADAVRDAMGAVGDAINDVFSGW